MKIYSIVFGLLLFFSSTLNAQVKANEYKIQKKIPVSGNGTWDYLTVDNYTHRIFVSHDNCVQVINLKTGKQVGIIKHTPGVHSVLLVPGLGKGFITAGKIDSVIVFDLSTYETLGRIPTGKEPRAILYDPFSKRVFAFNAKGNSITVINANYHYVEKTVALQGSPAFAVDDPNGNIYVNLQNLGMIVKIDAMSLKTNGLFPVGFDKQPTGLVLDKEHGTLFCACSGTNELIVVNINSGETIASIPIGVHCDGVCFIPERNEIFTSNGEGSVTIIHRDAPDKFTKEQTLITKRGARTIACDLSTKTIYVSTSEFDDVKKDYIPGSFQLIAISK
jgi:DNA-binding beta-propeller fold protein YncE